MGVEVTDERPYEIEGARRTRLDLRLRGPLRRRRRAEPAHAEGPVPGHVRRRWSGEAEVDGFNSLVVAGGLTGARSWCCGRTAATCARPARRTARSTSSPPSSRTSPPPARSSQLFEVRFDPAFVGDRAAAAEQIGAEFEGPLERVASLDRTGSCGPSLALVQATWRTNAFQVDAAGARKPYISFKLDPAAVPDLRSRCHSSRSGCTSPRVEGVHLRFGRSPAVGCAGRTAGRTSAPRSWDW